MNFNFSQLIREIESEISVAYLPEAIHWADESHNGAWSQAIDRFDQALSQYLEKKDPIPLQLEAQEYKKTVLGLLQLYQAHLKLNQLNVFISSLESLKNPPLALS